MLNNNDLNCLSTVSKERSIPCSYPFCTRKRKFRYEFDLKQHLENPGKWHGKKGNISNCKTLTYTVNTCVYTQVLMVRHMMGQCVMSQ